jgi:hypothetical protein
MEPDRSAPVPDAERPEPRVRDDLDPEQGPPVEDDDERALEDSPAIGVIDPDREDPPEPSEPG